LKSVLEPHAAGTSERIGRDVGAAPRTRVHVLVPRTRRGELDAADRAGVRRGRHVRSALGTLGGHRRRRGESHAAHARRRGFRHEAAARGALIKMEGALRPWGGPPGGIGQIPDAPQVGDDLGEGSRTRFDGTCRRRPRIRRDPPGLVGASRAPGKGGPAVLASIDLERRELPTVPTQNLGGRGERLHEPVELATRLRIDARS